MASQDPEIDRELKAQQETTSAVRSVGLRELEDDVAERHRAGIYNQLERRSGWVLVVVGLALVLGYSTYELLTEPDIHTVYRLGLAALIVGFGLLISGVLRTRMKLSRYDKYKEVIR